MWRKMFYGGKIGLGMVFFIMICQSVSADVVNIYPSEDSWIASGEQSTTPHGSDTYLWVANPPHYTAYGLVKFDVSSIPEGSTIQSVCLRIFCYHNKYETVDYLNIYQVTSAWDESKVTWRDSPEFDPIPLAMVEVKDSLQDKWVDWRGEKLTDVVKKWLEDRQSNQGLLICALTESYNTYGFVSKEATSSKPVLGIEFTPPRADILSMWKLLMEKKLPRRFPFSINLMDTGKRLKEKILKVIVTFLKIKLQVNTTLMYMHMICF